MNIQDFMKEIMREVSTLEKDLALTPQEYFRKYPPQIDKTKTIRELELSAKVGMPVKIQ